MKYHTCIILHHVASVPSSMLVICLVDDHSGLPAPTVLWYHHSNCHLLTAEPLRLLLLIKWNGLPNDVISADWLIHSSLLGDLFLLRRKYCNEYVCLCVCLSFHKYISGTTRVIFTNLLCTLPMSVDWSSSGTLTIGRIAHRQEGGKGSAQRGRSVIYDCLVIICAV